MKKLLIYISFCFILLINTAAGCDSKTEDPQSQNIHRYCGKMETYQNGVFFTKSDGTRVNDIFDTAPRGINIVYEYFADGRLVVKDMVKNESEEIRWKVNIHKGDGKGILDGELIQIGPNQKELAQLIGQSGDLTFQMSSTEREMFLRVDVTKQSAYKQMDCHQYFIKM